MNKIHYILSFFVLTGIVSCETEFDPVLYTDPTPVVYSLIDNADTAHWVKLTKSFIMDKGVTTNNISTDSLGFPGAKVFLERWNGDYIFDRAELQSYEIPRDEGLFPKTPNHLYYLPKNANTQGLFSDPNPNDIVKLIIDIPGLPVVYSEAVSPTPITVSIPRRNGESPYLYGEKVWEITWRTYAYYTELFLEFCYFDHYSDSVIAKSTTWRESHSIPNPTYKYIKTYREPIGGQHLMIRIAGNLQIPDKQVRYRSFDRIKIHYYSTDESVYTHNLTSLVRSIDQTGIQFNNIVNGLGLFGTRSREERWIELDYVSMDSLAKGRYTKDLGFTNW